MTLAKYLKENGISDAEFARRAGLSQPFVNRLKRGKASVSMKTAIKINEVTGGAVTPNDFLPKHAT